MKLLELTNFLEGIAPLSYQEDYDNSGLLTGDPGMEISNALISLDCTEAVVDEAISNGCDVIISHHPIIFKGLKKLTGKTYPERVVIKAIKHDVALYAIHTNFDNVLNGVNAKICQKLRIFDTSILSPKENLLKKLVTFCPVAQCNRVRDALFDAGGGYIGNYSECSFNTEGFGTFKPGENTDPFSGEHGQQHHEPEVRIELIYQANLERRLLVALHEAHPYEEVAYDLYSVSNKYYQAGSGMIGQLKEETDCLSFLQFVKKQLGCRVIRHTALPDKKIKRIAVCGGAGSFLFPQAMSAGADVFITADYKYHEFFDADKKIVIADVGHFESEQFTQELLMELITEKFPNFALRLTTHQTNPINYLI